MPKQDPQTQITRLQGIVADLKAEVKDLKAHRRDLQRSLTDSTRSARHAEKVVTTLQGAIEKLERQLVDNGLTPVTKRKRA